MWSTREEIEGDDFFNLVFFGEDTEVAGLSGGITGEVNNFSWCSFEEFFEEFGVAAGAGRIKDDGLVGLDKV